MDHWLSSEYTVTKSSTPYTCLLCVSVMLMMPSLMIGCKPKFESNDPQERRRAIDRIEDQVVLARVAVEDYDRDVRRAAFAKLNNDNGWAKVALDAKDVELRRAAAGRLTNQTILAKVAMEDPDWETCRAAVERLTDQGALFMVMLEGCGWNRSAYPVQARARDLALQNLTDQGVLATLAARDYDRDVRHAAFAKLNDPNGWAKVAEEADDPGLRQAAVAKLTDQTILVKVAMGDKYGYQEVRKAAVGKLIEQSALVKVALEAQDPQVRGAAVHELTDQTALAKVAVQDHNQNVCQTAFAKLNNNAAWAEVAENAWDVRLRQDATAKLSDQTILTTVGLGSQEYTVREVAAATLGKLRDAKAVDALVETLTRDESEAVRAAAAKALGQIQNMQSLEALSAALEDKGIFVRWAARDALVDAGPRALDPLLRVLKSKTSGHRNYGEAEISGELLEALGHTRDARAIGPLINVFKNSPTHISGRAGDALVEIGPPSVPPLLEIVSTSTYPSSLRNDTACLLGRIGDTRAVEPLITLLKSEDASSSRAAALALGGIRDVRAVASLIEELKGGHSYVRTAAATALGEIGDPKSVEALVAAIVDKDRDVRRSVATALGQSNNRRGIASLVSMMSDREPYVREAAVAALVRLGWEPEGEEERAEWFVRLGKWDEVAKLGRAAHDPLVAALYHERPDVRRTATRMLAEMEGEQATEALVRKLTDWWTRAEVVSALKKLNWHPTTDAEKVHFWVAGSVEKHVTWLSLGDGRSKAVVSHDYARELQANWTLTREHLLKDMESNDHLTVECALFAFIASGKTEIIPELLTILEQKGTKTLAEAYLNCGNHDLAEAAKAWASRHGYIISSGSGGTPVGWGTWSQ